MDDDPVVRDGVSERLRVEGFDTVTVSDGDAAIEAVRAHQPDLVVLDLQLPGTSGFEVLRNIHVAAGPPVILLSGLGDETDRVLGLEMGADDYVTKPFSARELAVRARRVLDRVSGRERHEVSSIEGSVGGEPLAIDLSSRRVVLAGEEVVLRPREFDLLVYFAQHSQQVLTKSQLLRSVWEVHEGWVNEATVTEHVRRLRLKLGGDAATGPIDTLWGVGYRFDLFS